MKVKKTDIARLIEHHKKLSDVIHTAEKAGVMDIDGVLFDAIWVAWQSAVDIFDPHGWISWYIYDNEYGNRGMTGGYTDTAGPVRSIDDLVKLMNQKPPK